jgi:glyoxylase-like metal-dependent hydrolase (beta-lactamase superfamily II)
MEIHPGIFQLKNRYVNLYLLVEPSGVTLIDTGIAKSGAKLVLDTLSQLGHKPTDLKFILITHADPDHTGSVAELKTTTGATVLAHPLDGQAMQEGRAGRRPKGIMAPLINLMLSSTRGDKSPSSDGSRSSGFVTSSIPPQAPDDILNDGQELPLLGGLQVISTPGHTPGHIAFYLPSRKILFAGDALMSMRGKLSFMNSPFTWDYPQGMQSVQKLSKLGVTTVCCGHGTVVQGEKIKFPFQS